MAETTLSPSPAAAPAAPPPPPKPSTAPPIQVTPAAVDKGPQAPPPKPGSAKDRMFEDLRKKAGMEEETPPVTSPKSEMKTEADTPPDTTITGETAVPAAESSEKPKGKVSPWKLVDEHKAARLKAETELAELRKTVIAPEKVKEIEEKAAQMEKRAKELEEHIKFVDYSKSKEFQDKYQKPYEDAWKRWMGELGELTLQDASGSDRPIQPQDLLELVNLPLQKAREQADQVFGAFADDVMSARKEIRSLFEAQSQALAEARKMGKEREAQTQQQMSARQKAMADEIGTLWTKSNEMAVADERFGKFFKPNDGDEEGNTRLKKGYEIADRAFSVSPLDPSLSPEQRQQIVQLHAAVRNRAAAFGRLAYQNEKLSAELATLKAELDKFKTAQPGAGEGRRETTEQPGTSAHEQVFAALRKFAH